MLPADLRKQNVIIKMKYKMTKRKEEQKQKNSEVWIPRNQIQDFLFISLIKSFIKFDKTRARQPSLPNIVIFFQRCIKISTTKKQKQK